MSPPPWLPDMFPVDPWTHDTYDRLYSIFERDFKHTRPYYDDHVVWFFSEMDNGKERIFWHLTSREDKITGDRYPDLRRSERLPWARPMLDNGVEPEILAWDHEEGRGIIKTYVWLKEGDYVVIMKKYKDGGRRLITSFFIDYDHKKRKLLKKYQKRVV